MKHDFDFFQDLNIRLNNVFETSVNTEEVEEMTSKEIENSDEENEIMPIIEQQVTTRFQKEINFYTILIEYIKPIVSLQINFDLTEDFSLN